MIVHVPNLFNWNLLKQNKSLLTRAQGIYKIFHRQSQLIGFKQQKSPETIFALNGYKPERRTSIAASACSRTCCNLNNILEKNISNMVTAEEGVKYLEIPDKSENDKKHYKWVLVD